ncbi:hypothetical protein [Phormidium nigroviride]|nr:hypothetical protein [Oscillatoria nigro-viridis]
MFWKKAAGIKSARGWVACCWLNPGSYTALEFPSSNSPILNSFLGYSSL